MRVVPKFTMLRENNVRRGFVDEQQYQRLIQYAESLWFRTAVEIGHTVGWRRNEVLNLRVWNVDLNARTLGLDSGTTKNDQARTVVLTDTLYALLRELVRGKKQSDYLMTRPEDNSRVVTFDDRWQRACCKAGLGHKIHRQCFERAVKAKGEREVDAQEFTLFEKEGSRYCSHCGERVRHRDISYNGLLFHDLRRSAVRDMIRAGVPGWGRDADWRVEDTQHCWSLQHR